MKCNRIKDLIMDYIDSEGNEITRREIACHLDVCASCKRIEQSLRSNIVEPLRKSVKVEAPDSIWCEIKEDLTNRKAKPFLPYLLFQWMDYLRFKRPVLVAALAITVLFFVTTLYLIEGLVTNNKVSSYMREELQFLSQLSGKGGYSFVISDMDLGTSIEKYFL